MFTENPGRPRLQEMWKAVGKETITCIVNGAIAVAEYWESGWKEGRSDANAVDLRKLIPTIDDGDLMALYRDKMFMQSRVLSQMKLHVA